MSSEAGCFPDALAPADDDKDRRGRIDRGKYANVSNPQPALTMSDEELLAQIGDGAKEALSILFRRHRRAVLNVAHRILKDESEAEDLCQEVFLFLFQKAALFDSKKG